MPIPGTIRPGMCLCVDGLAVAGCIGRARLYRLPTTSAGGLKKQKPKSCPNPW